MVLGVQSPVLWQYNTFNAWNKLNVDIGKLNGIKQVLSASNLFELKKDTLNQKFVLRPVIKGAITSSAEMDSIRHRLYSLSFYEGLIFNSKSNATLMAITFDGNVLNSKERIPVINSILAKTKAFEEANNIDIHYSGLPYIRTIISKKVSEEFVLFLGLSLLVASLILLVFFRSFYAVIFPVLVVVAGVIWSVGILVLFGYELTLLTGLIPPLIVVIGIPNSILLLNKFHSEFNAHGDKKLALRTVIEKISITTFIANLTTAVGFGVLYFTESELLMQFGSVAAIGVMITWLICLCLIPIIFSYLPDPHTKHTKHLNSPFLSSLLNGLNNLAQTKRPAIYLTAIVLVLISFVGMSRVKINGYVVDDLPKKDPVYEDMGFFEKNFEGMLPLEVSIDTKRKNGVMKLPTIKKVEKLQDMIAGYPEFSRAVSLIEVLKFSSQGFYDGNPDFYRVPNEMEMNFILSYAANSGGNGNMLKSFIDSNRQVTRVSFQMADVGSSRVNKLLKEIKPRIDSIFNPERYQVDLTGSSVIFVKGTNYLLDNLRDSLLLAVALIALIMWVLFRGFKMILISIVPNLVPLIITAGIMGFFGIPLKPSTILIFSIALGIASDQTIYFLTRYRQELRSTNLTISAIVADTLKETGVSMIYVALILFFGFGIFIASTFGGTVSLGILLSITLLLALISNLTLLPALLLSLESRISKKNKSTDK
ncbi:MAG: MMPL family transporter [Sphingobacteriaceae bacterium]|nr:MMPL family transporter [Sphingobacteriaceae bacterium]